MKIKCPQCDFENEEGSKFCKNCNEPLSKQDYSEDNPYAKKNIDEEDKVRKRIEKEEKMRAEIRAFQAEKDKIEKEKKKSPLGAGCLVFLILVIAVCFIMFNPFTSQKEETQPSYISLSASVEYTGTQFIIKNNDNFDWLNVKMEVNGSFLSSGFILKTNRMEAGGTYTVGALQFAKKDGTRFNPVTYKPQKFDIDCDTPKGENAFWTGSWE